ncbi:MAG: hypothetical protein NVV72_15755 [Asticcacaulis sp.]|nr:hypothetical protein [Asticcacaulis sp.]
MAYIARPDLTARVTDFITLAEGTLSGILRTRRMITTDEVVVNSGQDRAALPDDLLSILYISALTDRTKTLTAQPPEYIAKAMRLRQSTPGEPLYYAVLGSDMAVCPIPSASKTYLLSYYAKIPALTNSATTNWLLQDHPELYLYTALMHAAPYMADDQRSQLFENSVVKMVQFLIDNNKRTSLEDEAYSEFKG